MHWLLLAVGLLDVRGFSWPQRPRLHGICPRLSPNTRYLESPRLLHQAIGSDPGEEFLNRRASQSRAINATKSGLAPIKETMALLFSPDKRQVDRQRAKFRDVIHEMQTAPIENVMASVSSNVRFFLSTNTTIFMDEMLEELDRQDPEAKVYMGQYEVTVAQRRAALVHLFDLILRFVGGFVAHTKKEEKNHQTLLRQIVETAKSKSKSEVDAVFKELRPHFREDFISYIQGEYERVTTPPMTEDSVLLSNLLQAIQARVITEVENLMGPDVSQVSRLLAFADEEQMATALRGSFLAGRVQPSQFLEMIDIVLADLEERMPGSLEVDDKATEIRQMHNKLSIIRSFTVEYLTKLR